MVGTMQVCWILWNWWADGNRMWHIDAHSFILLQLLPLVRIVAHTKKSPLCKRLLRRGCEHQRIQVWPLSQIWKIQIWLCMNGKLNRGSYMSDSVILKLAHELLENNKKRALASFFISFLTTNVLISILHYHECQILFIT